MINIDEQDLYAKTISREELERDFHNQSLILNSLHKRMFLLTGCEDFGDTDAMNGKCVDCFGFSRELSDKCFYFTANKT